MPRREKKTTHINREKILQAATKLIKERGVGSISLAEISAEVKISKGTLYYYYPTKSALVFAITEHSMNHMTERIIAWVEKSRNETQAKDIIRVVLETLLKSRARGQVHIYLIQEALQDESVRRRFVEEYAKWRRMLEDGMKSILPSSTDTATLSAMLLAMIYGLLVQNLLGAERPPLDRMAAVFAGLVPSTA